MALQTNGYRLGNTPFRHTGGAVLSILGSGAAGAPRNMGELPGRMRGLAWLTTPISALPHGGLAPNAWMLPQKPGAIASRGNTRITLSAAGSVSRGLPVEGTASIALTAAGDVSAIGSVAGGATITLAALGDVYGQAVIAGSASISITAAGAVGGVAFLSGSASITISAASTMGCTATVAGDAYLSAAAEGGTLTESAIAAAVWAALASSNNVSGTMGELLNGAGGGSSPGAVAAAVRAELAVELARIDAAITSRIAAGATVPADVRYVNGVLITGTGVDGDTWGPA